METKDHAKDQAKAQFRSICEMVKALDTKDDYKREQAEQTIQEDALSVEVRSDWYQPGESAEPSEFMILLCTGGPACRIIGELDQYKQPSSARIEYQDWGTPWTEFRLDAEQEETLLTYCRQFWFGE